MVNYINDFSTFLFFYFFGVSTLFVFIQVSILSYFFYFDGSTLFLINQVSKLFYFCILVSQLYFCSCFVRQTKI